MIEPENMEETTLGNKNGDKTRNSTNKPQFNLKPSPLDQATID